MKDQLQSILNKVPEWLKNKYILTIIVFAIIVLFLDGNNIFQLIKKKSHLHQMHKQEQQYEQELIELNEQKEAFENDEEALEKFAREEYRMKRDNEDVFVIVEKEKEK